MGVHSVGKLRRGLVVLAIALPALYVLFAGAVIVQDRQASVRQAGSDMRNIAATLNEHAVRTFGEADYRLRSAIAEIERRGLKPVAADERALHEILVASMGATPLAGVLGVSGPDGWMYAHSGVYPMPRTYIGDREYFAYLNKHRWNNVHISRLIRSRPTDWWTIPISRRIDNPDGSLKMIVGFGLDMAYFDHFYRGLQLGESARLLLVRRDGWVIMETPSASKAVDHNIGSARLFRQLESASAGVYQVEHSIIDGRARVVGYASLPGSRVIAVASVARDEVLQPWVTRSRHIAGLGAVSTILLLCLLRFLWLRLADLELAQEKLQKRNEDLDIAQQGLEKRNTELDAARRRFQELVDGIDGVVWEAILPEFRFTYVSGNAETISGYGVTQWVEDPYFWRDKLRIWPDGKPADLVLAIGASGLPKSFEHHIRSPDGKDIWLRSNLMIAGTTAGKSLVRGVTIDITSQKLSELQLFEAIHVDRLTRLPNRHALVERVEHALALARGNHSMVAIILIDVDKFNTLNDSLGHERGDQVLVQVAKRLQGCVGATDTLIRMGGDEFAIVVEDVDRNALKVEHLAERINETFDRKFPIKDRELYLTVSMGIALYPQDGQDYQTLVRNADTALYRTKAAGRNGWQFFDSSMALQVEHRLDMETALRHAIERGEFRLYYQPQRSLQDGSIVGAEALVRWERPNVGMVPPHEFIHLAEESGFIVALGNWVLRAACSQAADWSKAGLHMRIAVNVSAVQLQQTDFVEQVRYALSLSGLPPDRLELEITEGVLASDVVDALDKLHQIKAMDVELAVDDFGTGYSSLSYLKQMPVDRLKIDQSFVRDLPENPDDCAIVRTILALASNLELRVIAEGVESEAQLEFLRAEGCNEMQGFFLSPPLSADQFLARYIAAGRVLSPATLHAAF